MEKTEKSQRKTKISRRSDNGDARINCGVCKREIFSIPYYWNIGIMVKNIMAITPMMAITVQSALSFFDPYI